MTTGVGSSPSDSRATASPDEDATVSVAANADGDLVSIDTEAVAQAVRRGADRARESVVRPQEGTILSVADATADEVERVIASGGRLGDVTRAAVDAAQAARSGRAVYTPGGGLQGAGASLVLLVPIGDKWGAGALLNYERRLGDVADSPLSQNDDAFRGGLFIARRFGG